MRRREAITLLGFGAAVLPLATLAQSQGPPVIGFLNGGSAEPYEPMVAAFIRGLGETGFAEGQNVSIIYRWADGDYGRLPELAAELVSRRVDVLAATGGDVSALAAKAATATIPVVFNIGGDPVRLGLVASLGQPRGNITGVVQFTFELATKRMEALRDLVPQADKVAALFNPTRPNAEGRLREVEEAARAYGKRLVVLNAADDEGIDVAFTTLVKERAEALLVGSDPFFFSRRRKLVELTALRAVPAIYDWREYPVIGGLMSYGTNLGEAYRQVGLYVGRILKGESPTTLPVVQSTKFELVINLRTARALGLDVPNVLLAQADEILE